MPHNRPTLPPFPTLSYTQAVDRVDRGDRLYRNIQSCVACRRRKQKCDRTFPCSACKARGEEDQCVETTKEKPAKSYVGYAHLADFDKLVDYCRSLEEVVASHERMIKRLEDGQDLGQPGVVQSSQALAGLTASLPETRLSSGSSLQPDGSLSFSQPVVHSPKGRSKRRRSHSDHQEELNDHHDEATDRRPPGFYHHSRPPSEAPSLADHNPGILLEDLALRRSDNVQRETMALPDDAGQPSPIGLVTFPSSQQPSRSTPTMVHVPGIECLPDAALTRLLLEIFLSDFEWMFRCLHVPTFRQSCDEAALQSLTNPMSVDRAFLLALQCACLTVTLHLLDPDQLTLLGFDENRRSATSAAWSRVMTTTLECADWMQKHRIESLQAFIIIGPYWCSIDRSEAYWAMLGTATKVAHSLGIHNLGTELGSEATFSQIRRHFGPRWVMAAARETGRRVWYSLVDLEIMSCSDHRWSSSHPLRFQWCARPANVDDDALIGYASVVSKPPDVYTGMSYHLARMTLLFPWNALVTKVNEAFSLRYSFIEQAHTQYIRLLDRLPAFFKLGSDLTETASDAAGLNRISAERFLIHCDINSRLIKLHRIYLPGALLSKHYRLSRQASITHARQVLDALPRRPNKVSLRWWPLNLTVFSATVALFCVCVESRDSPDPQLVEATRQGVSWLSQSSATRAFEESAGALQTLLAEDLEMRDPSRQLSNLGRNQDSESSAHRLLRQVLRFQSSQLAPSSATGATPQNVMGAQPSNDDNPFASSTNDINFDFMGGDQVPLTNDFFAAVGQDPFVFDWDAFPTVTEPELQASMNYLPPDDLFGGTDVDILNVLRRTFPVDPRVMDDFFGQGSQTMATGT